MTASRSPRAAAVAVLFVVLALLAGCSHGGGSGGGPDTSSASNASASPTGTSSRSVEVTVDGESRHYLLRLPATGSGPRPLVIFLHGSGGDGSAIDKQLAFDDTASKAGIVAVYPDGSALVNHSWRSGCCIPAVESTADLDLLSTIINDLVRQGIADATHVVVAGFSSGALMAYDFACQRSHQVAAVVSAAGSMLTPPLFVPAAVGATLAAGSRCAPTRPVSIYEVHGSADKTLPIAGVTSCRATVCGPGVNAWQAPVATVDGWWRQLNGCGSTAQTQQQSGYQRSTYQCNGGTQVSLTIADGIGHDLIGLRRHTPLLGLLVAAATGDPNLPK